MTPDRGLDWGLIERRLRALLPARAVVAKRQELLAYDCDGLTLHRHQPPLVVLPETTEQVVHLQFITGHACVTLSLRNSNYVLK